MNAKRGSPPRDAPKWGPVGLSSLVEPLLAPPETNGQEAPPERDQAEAAHWIGRVLLGRYRIVEPLGEGGMAWVYRAERIGRVKGDVAIKILKPETAESRGMISRFLKEADAIARVDHPNVVRFIESGELEDGIVFIVMDCLRGKPLQDLLRELVKRGEVFSWQRLAPLMQQACDALQAAHDLDLVHRDIKPNNLFVCRPESKAPYIKILDFGIAKEQPKNASNDSIETPLTQEGMFLGTPHYAAPEIIVGRQRDVAIDGRADVFSLGVVMYQCLTGTLPFQAVHHDKLSVLYHTAYTRPQPPLERAPERNIPPEVDALVMRALAIRVEDRFRSAEELSDAIKTSLQSLALTPERSGKGVGIRSGSIVELGQTSVREPIVKSAPERIIVAKRPPDTEERDALGANLATPIHGSPTTSTGSKSPTVPQDTGRRTPVSVIVVLLFMVIGLLVLLTLIVLELQPSRPSAQEQRGASTVRPAQVDATSNLDKSSELADEQRTAPREPTRVEPVKTPLPNTAPAPPPLEVPSTQDGPGGTLPTASPPGPPAVTSPTTATPAAEGSDSPERRRVVREFLDNFARSGQATSCLPFSTMFGDGVHDQLPVRLRVDEKGKATASVTALNVDRKLAGKDSACIVAAIEKLEFPGGKGTVIVSHTLKFD